MIVVSKHSKLVKTSANRLLHLLETIQDVPSALPSVAEISLQLDISRTTVQKLIAILFVKGIARRDGKVGILLRRPLPVDYFSEEDCENSKADQVEKYILKKLSSYQLRPGDRFSELELAKEMGTSTIIMREALLRIAQTRIIKKHPHQKWEVIEFSRNLITEISAVRRLLEDHAVMAIATLADADPIWAKFRALRNRHHQLLTQEEISHAEMRAIERDFHTSIILATCNRFIIESYNTAFTLVVYHLWQIEYDRPKIERVLSHHLQILEHLEARDFVKAGKALGAHLEYAEQSMTLVNESITRKL
jgi:DNA-binding GntR family transcriptional regulator